MSLTTDKFQPVDGVNLELMAAGWPRCHEAEDETRTYGKGADSARHVAAIAAEIDLINLDTNSHDRVVDTRVTLSRGRRPSFQPAPSRLPRAVGQLV